MSNNHKGCNDVINFLMQDGLLQWCIQIQFLHFEDFSDPSTIKGYRDCQPLQSDAFTECK